MYIIKITIKILVMLTCFKKTPYIMDTWGRDQNCTHHNSNKAKPTLLNWNPWDRGKGQKQMPDTVSSRANTASSKTDTTSVTDTVSVRKNERTTFNTILTTPKKNMKNY